MWHLSEFLRFLSRRAQTTGMRHQASSKRAAPRALILELLEDRTLLSFFPAVPPTLAVSSFPQAVATGDFNGDGKLDLVVANNGSGSVSVLLSNGDGTFQAASNLGTGTGPRSVAVGDFDNDGQLDVVTANAGNLSVLLRNVDSTFKAASTVLLPTGFASPANASPLSVAVGDLNKDGKMDLVATSTYTWTYYNAFTMRTYSHLEARVDVLLGNGAGTFAPPTPPAFPFYTRENSIPSSLALGDLDGDGKLDVLVGNNNGINTVSVLPGNGDGTLDLARGNDYGTGNAPRSMAVGDVNGDSKLDLVTANNGSNDVSVLLGNGDATFQNAVSYAAGTSPTSVALGDFNKDGNLDLAVTNSAGVRILLGFGDGTLQKAADYTSGSGPASVAVGDFNADGFSDLAVANSGASDVSVLLNDTDWTSIIGPTVGARNQTLTFTLNAIAGGLPASTVFTYDIDWDGDGIVDQTLNGVSGTTVAHSYAAGGSYTIGMTATVNGHTSALFTQAITIAASVSVQTDPRDTTKQALVIDGTSTAGETIVLSPGTGNGVMVSIAGISVGNVTPSGTGPFGTIIVHVGSGVNDVVQLTGGLNVQALIFGGNGGNTLDASGSSAANVLVGGAGKDTLTGGSGNDVLIGGLGADTINGSGGDDVVIGGRTKFDSDQMALLAIMAEWSRTDETYATRVSHLKAPPKGKGGVAGLNGSIFLNTSTVFDDAAIDALLGGSGTDWFFAKPSGKRVTNPDTLADKAGSETVTTL